jgi:hypothetical protein
VRDDVIRGALRGQVPDPGPGSSDSFTAVKDTATGLAFVVFPALFAFGFAVHPGLRRPHVITDPAAMVARAHGDRLLHVGHVAVLACCPLLIAIVIHYASALTGSSAEHAGLIGAGLAMIGVVALAADKGALCLTMSAFDTLPEREFAQLAPGLRALYAKAGWMRLLWAVLLLPLGFAILAVALLAAEALPAWRGIALLVGSLLLMVPDGLELVDLAGCAVLAVAMLPTGVELLGA